MIIYLLLCLIFLILIQGGYYPQTYIIVGIISALLIAIRSKKYSFLIRQPALIILTLMYVVSSMVNGMSYSVICKAVLPLTIFVVSVLYTSVNKEQKDKLMNYITIVGLISSVIGIAMVFGVFESEATVINKSLMFTFQYANTAGCWYAVAFLLAVFSKNRYIRYSSVLCLAALILTRSIGAIIILTIILALHGMRSDCFQNRFGNIRFIRTIIVITTLVFFVIGIIFVFSIGIESLIERVIHSYDGLRLMMTHIVFGIGPDNWQYIAPYNQSAYYSAGVIHNSYVQAGVDAGLMSMLMLVAMLVLVVYKYINNKSIYNLAALFVMLHSLIDYNLYFASIDVLLVFLVMYDNEENYRVDCKGGIYVGVMACSCLVVIEVLSFAFYGNIQLRSLEVSSRAGDIVKATSIYNDNELFMKNGYMENELYGICSVINKNDYVPAKQSARYRRYEMIYNEKNDIDTIIGYIKEQPNNRNVRIEADKLVKSMNLTKEDLNRYNDYVDSIDDSIKGWLQRMSRL